MVSYNKRLWGYQNMASLAKWSCKQRTFWVRHISMNQANLLFQTSSNKKRQTDLKNTTVRLTKSLESPSIHPKRALCKTFEHANTYQVSQKVIKRLTITGWPPVSEAKFQTTRSLKSKSRLIFSLESNFIKQADTDRKSVKPMAGLICLTFLWTAKVCLLIET